MAERVIYGLNPIREAINSSAKVRTVFAISRPSKDLELLLKEVRIQGVPVETLAPQEFERRFGGKTQGIAALVETDNFLSPSAFLQSMKSSSSSIVLILDQIQDPQNLGALLRTAEASGVDGVGVSLHRTAPFSPVVFKTSAGAIHHLNICRAPSLTLLIDGLKEKGYWLAGTDAKRGDDLYSVSVNFPLVLIVGSEGWGVRPLLLKKCDFILKIPMFGKVNSLNVSVACGVVLYELRRRQKSLTYGLPDKTCS